MRTTKAEPFALMSIFTVALFFFMWHQDVFARPVLRDLGKISSLDQKLPSDVRNFTKESNSYAHLGYHKVIYHQKTQDQDLSGSVLVVSSIANEHAFGKGRGFEDFYDTIMSLKYPTSSISLAFYCGSLALFSSVMKHFDDSMIDNTTPYRKVTLLYAPFLQTNFKSSEHDPKVQTARRRSIASGRNFVLLNSLEEEEYTLFLDADIVRFDHTDMLSRFAKSGKDIIVPRVERGDNVDYDKNSWRGKRITPTEKQIKLMDENKWEQAAFVPMDVGGEIYHLGSHADEVKGLPESDEKRQLSYLVDLDSVGGAVLFARSIIYKQGIVFPTFNAVGTSWSRKEGYDGIETEGFCYAARTLGFKCYAMPNLVAQHTSG